MWIYNVADMVLNILAWAIVVRAMLSWFPNLARNPIMKILYEFTEPLLRPFRKIRIGNASMMMDLSPVFAILAIYLVRGILLPGLFRIILTVFTI
ncbi:MAG: YggT family protein [Eubacteriales bacterium]